MVDVSKALETNYVSVELIKSIGSIRATIIAEGSLVQKTFDNKTVTKLDIPISYNGVKKLYSPNRDSLKNISMAYGNDTMNWVNRDILLSIVSMKGKDTIIAIVSPLDKVK